MCVILVLNRMCSRYMSWPLDSENKLSISYPYLSDLFLNGSYVRSETEMEK